jgi:dTDP-4-dehydrorhamnose reductase
MLGHAMVRHLRASGAAKVVWTERRGEGGGIPFDALGGPAELARLFAEHGPFRWIINCLAVLQTLINEADPDSVRVAETVNGRFPRWLAEAAALAGARVVHVSTDAVFPPHAGRCAEGTPPEPANVYARSKLHGEVVAGCVLNLRCSLVGPDPRRGRGLVEWLCSRPPGATVPGFTDHLWVGCTTTQGAVLCRQLVAEEGLFEAAVAEGPTHHFCPCAPLSKYELLLGLVTALGLDLKVRPVASGRPVTRQLDTDYRVLQAVLPKYAPIGPALVELALSVVRCPLSVAKDRDEASSAPERAESIAGNGQRTTDNGPSWKGS